MSEEQELPCTDKLAFDTKEQAEANATSLFWRHGKKLKTYKCTHCGLWHLSSSHD